MTQEQWTAVEAYFTDLLVPLDPALDAALQTSAAAGLPPHNVSPNQGKLLLLLAQIQGARTILEDWHAGRLQYYLAGAGATQQRPSDHAGG